MYTRAEYLIQALLAGASGYVVKQAAGQELVAAIQALYHGQPYLSPEVAPYLAGGGLPGAHRAAGRPVSAPLGTLTDREREVLRDIAEEYTTHEIAGHLCLSPRTVETYRVRLMQKLGLRCGAEPVRYALRWGILIPESWDTTMATPAQASVKKVEERSEACLLSGCF